MMHWCGGVVVWWCGGMVVVGWCGGVVGVVVWWCGGVVVWWYLPDIVPTLSLNFTIASTISVVLVSEMVASLFSSENASFKVLVKVVASNDVTSLHNSINMKRKPSKSRGKYC